MLHALLFTVPVHNYNVCRYEVIKNVYVPSPEFKFPAHDDFGKQQRFSHAWLQDHSPWLAYSKVLNGGFCLPCVLFARPQANVDVGVLVTKPLTTFNKACLLYTSPSPRDATLSRMPSSA